MYFGTRYQSCYPLVTKLPTDVASRNLCEENTVLSGWLQRCQKTTWSRLETNHWDQGAHDCKFKHVVRTPFRKLSFVKVKPFLRNLDLVPGCTGQILPPALAALALSTCHDAGLCTTNLGAMGDPNSLKMASLSKKPSKISKSFCKLLVGKGWSNPGSQRIGICQQGTFPRVDSSVSCRGVPGVPCLEWFAH